CSDWRARPRSSRAAQRPASSAASAAPRAGACATTTAWCSPPWRTRARSAIARARSAGRRLERAFMIAGRSRIAARVERLDWHALVAALRDFGWARTGAPLLSPEECAELIALYSDDSRFRSRVDMERFRFGAGEYKYFADPLPPLVKELRARAYPYLAGIANEWMKVLGSRRCFPPTLGGLLAACRRRGQTKPTPLLLRYATGGYNCLHQDVYGDVTF